MTAESPLFLEQAIARVALVVALLWAFSTVCAAQVMLQLQPGSSAGTLAGSGRDGMATPGAATASALGSPHGMAYDSGGNLLVADTRNQVIVRITPAGVLTVVAGDGQQGYTGDGGPATAAALNAPSAVVVDAAGAMYIADTGNHCIRKVDSAGVMSTVAGTGLPGNAGDSGPATAAQLRQPRGLAIDASGTLYIADTGNHRVRELLANGMIVAFAGTGSEGNDGDGGPAAAASFQSPTSLSFVADGSLLITDTAARRIRQVSSGRITAYAALSMRRPEGIAADGDGSVYVADAGNQVVVQSALDGSSSIAGSGEQGAFAAGVPASSPMDSPAAVALGSNGDVVVSDRRNHQVQRIALARIDFGSVAVGTMSAVQTVALHNAGAQPLRVIGLSLPAGFVMAASGTTCGAVPFTLQSAAGCVVAAVFAPLTQGVATGVAQVRVDGAAPQSMLLTGAGVAVGALASSVTSLTSNGSVSYAGAAVTLNVAVAGALGSKPSGMVSLYDGSALMSTVALSGGAAVMTTSSLTLGQHVLHAVYSGDAVYASSTSGTVAETVVATPDFAMTSAAASYSGSAGGTMSMALTLMPVNGTLNHAVTFGVVGLPARATATFLPAVVTLGGNPVPLTMTVQMPATLSSLRARFLPMLAGGMVVPLLFVRRRRALSLLMLVVMALLCASGCGSGFRGEANTAGSGGSGSSGGVFQYNAVVTATTTGVLGDTLTHSVTIGLVVTQ